MPIDIARFDTENWVLFPQTVWTPTSNQEYLLFLSGVALTDFEGGAGFWNRDTLRLHINLNGPAGSTYPGGPVIPAGPLYPGPIFPPPPSGATYQFVVDQCAPFATISSISTGGSVPPGFAVDNFRPHLVSMTDFSSGKTYPNIFEYLEVDVAVEHTGAWLYRVGYQITLLGKVVTIAPLP